MLPGPGCQSTGRKHWGRFKAQLPPDLVSLEPTAMSAAALPKPWSPPPHRPRPSPAVGIQYKAESLPPTNDIQRLFACLSHKLTQHFSWRSTAGQPSARPMTSFLYSSISSSVNGDCHPYLVGLLSRLKNILHVKFSAQDNNHIHTYN